MRRGRSGRWRGSPELVRAPLFFLVVGGLVALGLPAPPAGAQIRALRPSTEPLLSVGTFEAGSPYELFNVNGAMRLPDGGVVVMVRGHHQVRRFGPDGTHLWSVGRRGEGPLEFELPELLPTCSSDNRIVIYDRINRRVTTLDNAGEVVGEYILEFGDRPPYSTIKCSPSGRMAFTRYAGAEQRPSEEGPYRWKMDMAYLDEGGTNVVVFRSEIPGTDRYLYFIEGRPGSEGPLTWGRDVSVAPVDEGVWIGTGDRHEIEFIDWQGTSTSRIEWDGPNQEVTQNHVEAYRQSIYEWYEERAEPGWRQRYEELWAQRSASLPDRFPSHNTIMAASGLIWVKHFRPPADPEHHWVAFDDDGTEAARMFLPAPFIVQDLGSDWVLAVLTDEVGIEKLVVYELVEGS